ncbi:hypothetical protein MNBD_GAMMA01-1111 [hydrothermal vent metagenome]|uniref:HTH cro/C1-type domain-containing protein n=1 Tax=hydrothermal vent metagenome TaxID=652676 RepID=A0A3B0WFE8_9ZZZZ
MSLITVTKTQEKLAEHCRQRRLNSGLTQSGLANRAGVSLSTLRKFEQKGIISLESFLKLLAVFNALDEIVKAIKPGSPVFSSIDDVINATNQNKQKKSPQKGWRS